MAVDYRKLCVEIFSTDDENEIRRIASAVTKYEPGRKKKFTDNDIAELRNLYSNGMTIEMIAILSLESENLPWYSLLHISSLYKCIITQDLPYKYC